MKHAYLKIKQDSDNTLKSYLEADEITDAINLGVTEAYVKIPHLEKDMYLTRCNKKESIGHFRTKSVLPNPRRYKVGEVFQLGSIPYTSTHAVVYVKDSVELINFDAFRLATEEEIKKLQNI